MYAIVRKAVKHYSFKRQLIFSQRKGSVKLTTSEIYDSNTPALRSSKVGFSALWYCNDV